ncbi:MAG TPA: formate/nitrite transporter family protein [Thermomicrobiales bacterium]|nr:formate/nitrite transporter family protein [Thermomicrobiales bacterium]
MPKSRTPPDADVLNNDITPEADIRDDDQDAQAGEAIKEPTPMGQEAPEIVDDASKIGAKRLRRPLLGDAITAFTGGMSVSFGAVAMVTAAAAMGGGIDSPSTALLVGSLVFPVGFLILLVGKTELFTENFLLPVAAVLKGRGDLRQLGSLWGTTLAFNLLGALVFALLISRNHVISPGPAEEMIALATHSVNYSLWTAFIKALFAGWLMTTLTWLLVAAVGFGPRIAMIWAIGALIVLGQFNHVIISAAEIFIAMLLGADITFGDWVMRNFLPALAGNIFGGLVFETMLQYIQSQYHEPEEKTS